MNCGEGKVKSSLFRTRRALRSYLEDGGGSFVRAERLFRILGLVDESLIEEAVHRLLPRRCAAAAPHGAGFWPPAACLAVICGGAWGPWPVPIRVGGSTGEAPDGGRAWPAENPAGTATAGALPSFLSYAGPVFPLTTAETVTGLTAGADRHLGLCPGVVRGRYPPASGGRR